MLTGKDFGAAIGKAIELKIASGRAPSKAAIARHFGMQPPSLADWVKKGAVAKDKLPEMWRYFSDVVGPEHWGMTEEEWPAGLADSPIEQVVAEVLRSAGYRVTRIGPNKPLGMLPPDFKWNGRLYYPDFLAIRGDHSIYVAILGELHSGETDPGWQEVAKTGKLALITSFEPRDIRNQVYEALQRREGFILPAEKFAPGSWEWNNYNPQDSANTPQDTALTKAEQQLLENFRRLDDTDKATVASLARRLSELSPSKGLQEKQNQEAADQSAQSARQGER